MPGNGQPQSKYWCFTLNAPENVNVNDPRSFFNWAFGRMTGLSFDEPDRWKTTWPVDTGDTQLNVTYFVWQFERGGLTGHLHIQGYVELVSRMRMESVKEHIFHTSRVHLEMRRASAEEASDYCKKTEDEGKGCRVAGESCNEWGNISQSKKGCREDLLSCLKDIDDGVEPAMLRRTHLEVTAKYSRWVNECTMDQLTAEYAYSERRTLKVTVFWGESDAGKTHRARAECKEEFGDLAELFPLPLTTPIWYDCYHRHQGILLDDYGDDWVSAMPWTTLLKLLDIWPMRLNVKVGQKWLAATHIWITSNQHPRDWYPNKRKHYNTLARRFTGGVFFMSKRNNPSLPENIRNEPPETEFRQTTLEPTVRLGPIAPPPPYPYPSPSIHFQPIVEEPTDDEEPVIHPEGGLALAFPMSPFI